MKIEVIPARLGHVIQLAQSRWPAKRDMRRTAVLGFRSSGTTKVLRVDGQIVAAYGLVGSMLSNQVTFWMMTAFREPRHATLFVRACCREIRVLMADKRRVVAFVSADDPTALRFARHYGFEIGERMPNGMCQAVLDVTDG